MNYNCGYHNLKWRHQVSNFAHLSNEDENSVSIALNQDVGRYFVELFIRLTRVQHLCRC